MNEYESFMNIWMKMKRWMKWKRHEEGIRNIYKIIWIVSAFWLVYNCVFIALWSTKMTLLTSLAVSKLWEFPVSWKKWKFTLRASYIIFLFVKLENNDFIKEIKHALRAFIGWWKLGKVCENSRVCENPRLCLGFSLICSRVLPNVRFGFHEAVIM